MSTFEVLVSHKMNGPVYGMSVDERRKGIDETTLLRVGRRFTDP